MVILFLIGQTYIAGACLEKMLYEMAVWVYKQPFCVPGSSGLRPVFLNSMAISGSYIMTAAQSFPSFFLIKKKQKIKAERITSPFCQAAMFNSCTTVASTFVLYS